MNNAQPQPAERPWQGLLEEKDVASRRTGFVIDKPQRARQGVTRARQWFLSGCVVFGLLVMAAPYLAGNLVNYLFSDASLTVWQLRRVASELWFLFAVPGLLLALCGIVGLARKIPAATFNLDNQTINLTERRFEALPLRSGARGEVIGMDELDYVQIVHYKARLLRNRDDPVDQFELNLVLYDGSRRLIAKQPGYASLVDDASKLSVFLDVPFRDESGQSMLY